MRILSACETIPTRQESCDLSLFVFFFLNTELFLECVFVLLPGVEDRSEFTSAVVIHVPLWENMCLAL